MKYIIQQWVQKKKYLLKFESGTNMSNFNFLYSKRTKPKWKIAQRLKDKQWIDKGSLFHDIKTISGSSSNWLNCSVKALFSWRRPF